MSNYDDLDGKFRNTKVQEGKYENNLTLNMYKRSKLNMYRENN